jgi:hypothetical protein
MDLATAVKKYLELAGGFDRPVHLSRFTLPKNEIEKMFSEWDEDYQISRFMMLSREGDETLASFPENERVYLINGFECSHVTFHQDIQKLM